MRKVVQIAVGVACLCLLLGSVSAAQDQYNEGTVERVILLRILPGHGNAWWDDVKNNLQPLWNAEKADGLIEGYQIFLNQTKGNPDDWDVGIAITYKNMAALDGLGMKVLDLRLKQFGDKSKEQKVIDKRVENVQTVASYLIRNVAVK
jgi:hypothetical protein